MKPITVLIVDEHPEVSAGLAHGLSGATGFRVIAHTTNPIWAAEFAHLWRPDIVVADFKRGPRPRSEMVAWLKQNSPDSHVVVFSSYYLDGERNEFLKAGAVSCLLKGFKLNELATELRRIAESPQQIEMASANSKGR